MMYYYFYRITNNENGKYYEGVHATNNLDDGYMGSGILIKRAIKYYGIEKFTKTILEFFDTEEEMYAYERSVISKDKVRDPNCYNIAEGGCGGNTRAGKSEEECVMINQKMSESLKGLPAWNKGVQRTEETKAKISEKLKGRLITDEWKLHLSQSLKGKPKSEEHKNKISKSLKGKPREPRSEEAKQKTSIKLKLYWENKKKEKCKQAS